MKDSILCFPFGKGSTVGSYAMYQLKRNGTAPKAIVNRSAEATVATGAIMSDIPMVDGIDISLLSTGDKVTVDASRGFVELHSVVEKHVVTCILRNRGKILILRRSGSVGSYSGRWAGVSGFIEEGETPEQAAGREIEEEVGLAGVRLSRRTGPKSFRHDDSVWTVHPFLVDVRSRQVSTDWEHDNHVWIFPGDLGRYSTVPGLGDVVRGLLDSASP